MKRVCLAQVSLVLALAFALAACPAEKPKPAPVATDTTPIDLGAVKAAIPPAAPDTFKPPRPPQPDIPPAPEALIEAVQREQSFSKFCYQEFGQKADPSLRGGVAMVVTVDRTGITDARVRADSWSSAAGKAVNACLNEKAPQAWKTDPGEVKPGRYLVQLQFRSS